MKVLMMLFMVVGCSYESPEIKIDELHEKAKMLSCTSKQLDMVKKEFDICERTSYFSSHCFDMAKVSHCGQEFKTANK